MFVAWFSEDWHGDRAASAVTLQDRQFVLEGQGPVTVADLLEYDRLGQIRWADDGMRAIVGKGALLDIVDNNGRYW